MDEWTLMDTLANAPRYTDVGKGKGDTLSHCFPDMDDPVDGDPER